MITITRNLARQVRAVFRRALHITPRGLSYPVTLQTGPDGLRLRARSPDAVVEYHTPGELPIEQFAVPFQFLADCESKKDQPVTLEAAGERQVSAQWRDGSVPQIVQYDRADPADAAEFLRFPDVSAENPPGFLAALQDAMEIAEPAPIKYATDHVQLEGQSGKLVATDGRQLLVQTGYHFPWQGNLLVPRTTLFACRELPQDVPITIGMTGGWVALRVGPWTVWLLVNKDARFPEVHRHVPDPATAVARCQFSAGDAEFLMETLPRLPGDAEYNWPVTFDLNGTIAVRGKSMDQPRATEAVLSSSTWSGEAVRININRRYLARALELGLRELFVYGPNTPVLCQDDRRSYVWAVLDPESAITPADDALRILSPADGPKPCPSPPKPPKRRRQMTTEPNNPQEGQAKTNGQPRKTGRRKAGRMETAGLIQEAEAVRATLRDALSKTGELLKGLKRHKRQSRALESTLASLRQLKGLDG